MIIMSVLLLFIGAGALLAMTFPVPRLPLTTLSTMSQLLTGL